MKENREYCVYEGMELASQDMSGEHVIPLALGGIDTFVIRASSRFNSEVGTKLEGKLANELMMWQRRNEFDVRGQSGKSPVPIYKSGSIEELDLPIQVHLDKRNRRLRLYSPRDRRFLQDHESAGARIRFRTTLDTKLRLRFAAKVALGAGYFAYGRTFVDSTRVDHLRALMNLDVAGMSDDLKVADQFMTGASEQQKLLRTLGRHVGLSSVVIMPSSNDITFIVTCLKEFCGLLSVRANTDALPNEGIYTSGHVLACDGQFLRRGSLEHGLELLHDAITQTANE